MANRRYNTQTRKMFDSGSGPARKFIGTKKKTKLDIARSENRRKEKTGKAKQPIAKDMLDRNPNRTMDAKTKKRLRDSMDRRRKKIPSKIEIDKKPKKNTIKDKINKVGNMKVKDAAKVVGKAALATTPIGLATNAAKSVKKNFKFQSPIVSRKDKKFGGK